MHLHRPVVSHPTSFPFHSAQASLSGGRFCGPWGGLRGALQNFDSSNGTNIAFSSVARVVLLVFYLNRGYGLLTVALITVGLPLLASLVRAVVVLRLLPVKFSWKYVNRDAFRHMANYSGTSFVIEG